MLGFEIAMKHLIDIILLLVFLGGVVSIVALWTQRDIDLHRKQEPGAGSVDSDAQPAASTITGDGVAVSVRAPSTPAR